MDVSEYKTKVFDEKLLQLCLNLLDFLDTAPNQNAFLRQAVLDALVATASLEELNAYLFNLKSLPVSVMQNHSEPLLRSLSRAARDKDHLADYLITLRELASRSDFNSWELFFDAADIVFVDGTIVPEYLMTIRHLSAQASFSNWDLLFISMNVLPKEDNIFVNYFLTVRHLIGTSHFSEWDLFFQAIGVLPKEETVFLDYFSTIRRLAEISEPPDWEGFLTAFKILGNQNAVSYEQVCAAVRHAVLYFKKPESLRGIFKTLAHHPHFHEAFALGQLDSKQWLMSEAQKVWGQDWGTVFVLAGWIGVLPRFLFEVGLNLKSVRSFDINQDAVAASEVLNQFEVQKDWLYKSSSMDITKLSYPVTYLVKRKDGTTCELHDVPDIVINTSCEHFADPSSWWNQIPLGTRVILQSNDGFHIPEHVGCFKTLEDFEKTMSLSHVEYRGEKPLPEFKRFMLIGRK